MVRTETAVDEHKYPWWQVFLGVWHQYPAKERKDILSVDVIDRSYDPKLGILTSTKLYISKRSGVPGWLKKMARTSYYEYSREEIKIDIVNKTMTTKLILLSWKPVIKDYTLTRLYTPSTANPLWTARQTTFHCDVKKSVGWLLEPFIHNKHKRSIPDSRISLATSINRMLEKFPSLNDPFNNNK